ncbi:MAG: hypothetical protein UY04_C0055G0006 [Parcubacteria group bacterium GW2011_GWA2_47_7]|nr:MAG: hypothetical protein UY04_C0055G0006 [Parcubacteria group bacterium GW2011_GWA2_47_7]
MTENSSDQTVIKKDCKMCRFVRTFAIAVFLITVAYYFYSESQLRGNTERGESIVDTTPVGDQSQ